MEDGKINNYYSKFCKWMLIKVNNIDKIKLYLVLRNWKIVCNIRIDFVFLPLLSKIIYSFWVKITFMFIIANKCLAQYFTKLVKLFEWLFSFEFFSIYFLFFYFVQRGNKSLYFLLIINLFWINFFLSIFPQLFKEWHNF